MNQSLVPPDCGLCGTPMVLQADAPTGPTTHSWKCLNMTCQQGQHSTQATGPATPTPEGPLVAGDVMTRPIYEFVRACEHLLADEQQKANPDNALIAVLCDAVRLSREHVTLASWPAISPQPEPQGEGQRYGCTQCHTSFTNAQFRISVPGIPARTYLFCSADCREAWSRGDTPVAASQPPAVPESVFDGELPPATSVLIACMNCGNIMEYDPSPAVRTEKD